MNGFEPRLCYGEALLSFVWSGAISVTDAKKVKLIFTLHHTIQETYLNDNLYLSRFTKDGTPSNVVQHEFIRTHFNRATHCDYCGKKIWLKDAASCKNCNMSCHKKCIKKCQISTVCTMLTADAPIVMAPVEFKLVDSDKVTYTVEDAEVIVFQSEINK